MSISFISRNRKQKPELSVSSYFSVVESIKPTANVENAQIKSVDEIQVILPDSTFSVYEKGTLCSLSFGDQYESPYDILMRIQNIVISEKAITQVRQAFDGVYVGVYGGGFARITISGITKVWSGLCTGATLREGPNTEILAVERLISEMSSRRGSIFRYHDGIRARKWKVVPSSIKTMKTVTSNNLESYTIELLGAAFNQELTHAEKTQGSVQQYGGSIARYTPIQIL